MDNSVKIQAYVFFTVFYGGLIIGFIYDIYRSFRYYLNPTKIVTFIEDLIFWVLATLITFYILIKSNWGELRGYIFIGLFLGIYLYLKVLSKFIFPIFLKLFKVFYLVIAKIVRVLLYPLKIIARIFTPLFNKVKNVGDVFQKSTKDIRKYIKIISKKK